MNENIGYHTRAANNNAVKLCGGSFGGSVAMETVNRLVNAHFSVVVKQSGRCVFVDREGREVSLYISVDAEKTGKGAAALAEYRKAQRIREAAEEEESEKRQAEIDGLLSGLSHAEIIARLKG